jgi:hypothetical protein
MPDAVLMLSNVGLGCLSVNQGKDQDGGRVSAQGRD